MGQYAQLPGAGCAGPAHLPGCWGGNGPFRGAAPHDRQQLISLDGLPGLHAQLGERGARR